MTTLCEEQGGIEESSESNNAGMKSEFVSNSDFIAEKLREW